MTRQGKYPQELRERAVRMVFEHQGEHPLQWAAICSIAAKFGISHETLRNWVRRAEVDDGLRPGPACGSQPAPPRNAFYCPVGDFIAWDESGLMIPYYVGGGDFAAALVLAHEFGHAMQARLPQREPGRCPAGTAGGLLRRQLGTVGVSAQAARRRRPGRGDTGRVHRPRHARHPVDRSRRARRGFERTRAFGDGVELGAKPCYPAPAQRWILTRR
jgi:uncharacterized protein